MKRIDLMPSLSNVEAGSTATLSIPLGLSIDRLLLSYSGVTLAQLVNPRIEINGKVVMSWKNAARLDAINQYYNRGAANGILNFWFLRPEMKTLMDQRITAIGTADLQTLAFLVDIDAAAAAPVLKAWAQRSDQAPLGLIVKTKSFPASFATSGDQAIDNLPRSGARIGAIHLFKSDVSYVVVEGNGVKIIDTSKAIAEELQIRQNRTPQTAQATHVDFLLDGDLINQALPTIGLQTLRVNPTIDTSGALDVIVEYLDGFGGI
jgi:hypothetical protein